MSKPKTLGYFVTESCEDFEQCLGLDTSDGMPPGGVLTWSDVVVLFPTRSAARRAISRTEHYRLAFNDAKLPEKRFCSVKRAVMVDAS